MGLGLSLALKHPVQFLCQGGAKVGDRDLSELDYRALELGDEWVQAFGGAPDKQAHQANRGAGPKDDDQDEAAAHVEQIDASVLALVEEGSVWVLLADLPGQFGHGGYVTGCEGGYEHRIDSLYAPLLSLIHI